MYQKLAHILLILFICFHFNARAQKQVKEQPKNIESILALWNGNGNQFEMFPVTVWEKMLKNAYQNAQNSNDTVLLFKIKLVKPEPLLL